MARIDPSRQVAAEVWLCFQKHSYWAKTLNVAKDVKNVHTFPYTPCRFYIKMADFLYGRRVDPD